jgi:ArsR family transcriptional regulator, arsenate/arsenite/antimonite-responsive transcriptional repressor
MSEGPNGGSCNRRDGVLAERLSLPTPTLSFHLKELVHAGLIDGETQGRHIVYSARYEHMQALMDFLMENCCAAQECGCAPDEAEAK